MAPTLHAGGARGPGGRAPSMSHSFIKNIRNIPTLPNVLGQIIQTLDDPRASAADLERIVRNDQAITTKLLAVANSAYYGLRHQITTVRRAVVTIGFSEVRNVCLSLSLMGFLHPSTFSDQQGAEQLWLHSLAASEAARILAQRTGACDPGQAFTAGLLHDIGKVIMAAFAPERVAALREHLARTGCSLRQAEEALDLSHEQVGLELARRWDLPPVLYQAIGCHHSLERDLEHLPLAAVTCAADFMVRADNIGDSGNPDPPLLPPLALEAIEADLAILEECRRELEAAMPRVEQQWEELMASGAGA